jgi:hypothetical protein
MALKQVAVALCIIAVAAPASASASASLNEPRAAPPGSAETKYCLRVEKTVGNLLERIECFTRAEWDEQGIDVDKEWANAGVRIQEAAR